jgi:RNA polymerase sigma-70 factor (ECF subfamily)
LGSVSQTAPATDDTDLLARAQTGDRAAMDAWLRAYEASIYRFGLRMCGDEDSAREVLQRTMLAAFQQLPTFRGESKVSTWLYAIARSACSRLHRRTRSAPLHDVPLDGEGAHDMADDHAPNPADRAETGELLGMLTRAIGNLPTSMREVVVLRDVEGLTAPDAAQALGIGERALKSRLHRGRALLRRQLVAELRERVHAPTGVAACGALKTQLLDLTGVPTDTTACAAIEAHVSQCGTCGPRLGALRDATALCRNLRDGRIPKSVQRAVRAAIEHALESEGIVVVA